jgi:hypothetical protein
MTNHPPHHDQQKAHLIGSLLEALNERSSDKAQSLVSSGLQRLDEAPTASTVHDKSKPILERSRFPWMQAVSLVIAASIFIAVFLPFVDSSRNAMAALNRSIEQARMDVGRHYSVKMKTRIGQATTMDKEVDLFVKGEDRFAIRTHLNVWLGSNREKSWLVPPVGPVIEGDSRRLHSWVEGQDEISTPYLHISTVLEQLREAHELSKVTNVSLDIRGQRVACQYIVGILKEKQSSQVPNRIELWADAQSGAALKVIASWDVNAQGFGRESVTIELQDEIELDDAFFGPNAHGGLNRPRIDFSSR